MGLAGSAASGGLMPWLRRARRVPDLDRFTRGAAFLRFRAAAVAWVDKNFELTESGAPWLDGTGRQVADRCEVRRGMRGAHQLVAAREPPGVTCDREVTAVYGFGGALASRLTDLAAVLSQAGWGYRDGERTVPMPDLAAQRPPVWDVGWAPVAGHGYPVGLAAMPPELRFPLNLWIDMGIGWASSGESAKLVITRPGGASAVPAAASAQCQPVEVAGPGVGELAGQALAEHEHAIAIRISVCYYLNSNAYAKPGRLRTRQRRLDAGDERP